MTENSTNNPQAGNTLSDAERTQALLDRMEEQNYGIVFASNKACQTCLFAQGEVNWNGRTLDLTPDKDFCLVYEPDNSDGKPDDVSFEGAPCKYYEKG